MTAMVRAGVTSIVRMVSGSFNRPSFLPVDCMMGASSIGREPMTTVLGVSIGTGAVVLSFVAAKTSIFEKVYHFIEEHLLKPNGGRSFSHIGGDAARRDI